MCTVLLPPAVNPVAVNKYINIHIEPPGFRPTEDQGCQQKLKSP